MGLRVREKQPDQGGNQGSCFSVAQGQKKAERGQARGLGSYRRASVGEKQGQGHGSRPPPSPELRRLQLAPGRGPSTLELGQAPVAVPLLPSHPHF